MNLKETTLANPSTFSWFRIGLVAFLLLLLGSIGVMLLAVHQVWEVSPDAPYGLASQLGILPWVGASLLIAGGAVLTLIVPQPPRILRGTMLFAIALLYWIVVVFAEGPVRHQDAFWHMSTAEKIFESGFVDRNASIYMQWPGFFILGAVVLQISSAAPTELIKFYPIFIILVGVVIVRSILSHVVGDQRSALVGTVVTMTGMFYVEFHWSPNSVATFLGLLAVYAAFQKGPVFRAVAFLLLLAIVVIHPLTPIFVVLIFLAVGLAQVLPLASVKMVGLRGAPKNMVVVLIGMYITWLSYVATAGFASLARLGERFAETLLQAAVATTVSEAYSSAHPTSAIRKSIFIAIMGLGALGAGLALRRRQESRSLALSLSFGMMAAPLVVFIIAPIFIRDGDFNPRSVVWMMFGAGIGSALLASKLTTASGFRAFAVLVGVFVVAGSVLPTAEDSALLSSPSILAATDFIANAPTDGKPMDTEFFVGQLPFFNSALTREHNTTWDSFKQDPHRILQKSVLFQTREDARNKASFAGHVFESRIQLLEQELEGNPAWRLIFDSGRSRVYRVA